METWLTDQKKQNRGIKKKQIRIKKTNKDNRRENRQETTEREDQKKTNGDTYEKKRKIVGSKGSRLKNKSGWGGAGGRAEEGP